MAEEAGVLGKAAGCTDPMSRSWIYWEMTPMTGFKVNIQLCCVSVAMAPHSLGIPNVEIKLALLEKEEGVVWK